MLKFLGVLLLLASTLAWAQDGAQDSNPQNGNLDDDLFGGGGDVQGTTGEEPASDSFVKTVKEDANATPADDLLKSETVVIGGSFEVSAEVDLSLNPEEGEDAFTGGLTDLSTRLFLDARPNPDFRAFVKGDISYSATDGVAFELREAFSDINIAETVFLRAGKQTVNWGVGRFFSPANLINLETIDPEDPGAELAGPVAVKAQVPLGADNLTGYLILDDIGSGDDIGLATRYEFLVEGYELTVGGIYRSERPWAVMSTASGAIGDVTVFGEVVLEGNSDKMFILEDPASPVGLRTASSESLFVSGTLGAQYSYTTDDELYTVTGSAQYFFNGEGYEDPSVLTDNPAGVRALLEQGELSPVDLTERGQHYAAALLSSPDIADTNLTPSAFWLGNLSDGSGRATASLGYSGVENFTPSATYSYGYGTAGAEYSPRGDEHRLTLGFTLAGSF